MEDGKVVDVLHGAEWKAERQLARNRDLQGWLAWLMPVKDDGRADLNVAMAGAKSVFIKRNECCNVQPALNI
ncbi:hypothetical protein GJ744_004564 [Endocarpon pusillum]|uniref:Uncharacterized protein n=1 Tax=Endocarpon pusillum TaxID=364733 RepID=A0A8H7E7L6_9EURO|nr:hypothetical protein GJ744_004564 [Endocarpon pusillum]